MERIGEGFTGRRRARKCIGSLGHAAGAPVAPLKAQLSPAGVTDLELWLKGKTPAQIQDEFSGDLDAAASTWAPAEWRAWLAGRVHVGAGLSDERGWPVASTWAPAG